MWQLEDIWLIVSIFFSVEGPLSPPMLKEIALKGRRGGQLDRGLSLSLMRKFSSSALTKGKLLFISRVDTRKKKKKAQVYPVL